MQDFKKDPCRMVNAKLLSDLVGSVCVSPAPEISKSYMNDTLTLSRPGSTPWFDIWTKLYLHSIPALEHEFSRHHVGCLFAAKSDEPDAVQKLRKMAEDQHRHQHDKPNAYPQFMTPNVLKYYVLLHDVYDCGDESAAQEIFTQMQREFGANFCHLLLINSSKEDQKETSNFVQNWLNPGNRFCNVETRLEGMGTVVINTAASVVANSNVEEKKVS